MRKQLSTLKRLSNKQKNSWSYNIGRLLGLSGAAIVDEQNMSMLNWLDEVYTVRILVGDSG